MGCLQLNEPYDSKNKHVISEFKIPRHYGLQGNMLYYVYLNNGYYNKFIEFDEENYVIKLTNLVDKTLRKGRKNLSGQDVPEYLVCSILRCRWTH